MNPVAIASGGITLYWSSLILTLGVAAGVVFLHERPTPAKLVGITLIVAGLILTVL